MSARYRSRSRTSDRRGGEREDRQISLIVRNLPLDTRPEELRDLFGKYGRVRDVYLPRDYHTKRPKGFGFIEFMDLREAEDAIYYLDRSIFGRRELSVSMSREGRKRPEQMKERSGGGDYSRRGRRRSRSRNRSRSGSRRRKRSPSYSRSRSRSRSRGVRSGSPSLSRSKSPRGGSSPGKSE